ncbi:MAG: MATE family efflux transporter, partial [Eubacteriales bacterium]|nr:MATE family efflux transporter [Eubacteriales bacterium]
MQKIKQLFAPREMTSGTPWKSILMFAAPMLMGNFAQQLYSTVDSAVVGKYVGDNALAAVNSTMPVLHFLLALFVGIATGAGIRVSQFFGAHDRVSLSRVIGNCITLTAITALIVMVIGIPLVDPLLRLLQTPPEIVKWTGDYLRIVFWGITTMMYYNILSGILRGMGDSFSALGFLLLSAGLNVALDLWFVITFRWGVAGVALATVISQGVSGLLCLVKLKAMGHVFDLTWKHLRLDKDTVKDIIALGLPSGLTQATFSLAMLIVLRLENSFGAAFIAMSGIVKRVDGFAMLPNFSF